MYYMSYPNGELILVMSLLAASVSLSLSLPILFVVVPVSCYRKQRKILSLIGGTYVPISTRRGQVCIE